MKYKKVVRIAKYGHVRHGPCSETGELGGAADIDACNGAWADNGFYPGAAWRLYPVQSLRRWSVCAVIQPWCGQICAFG